jgi:hypothetical protein
MPFKQISLDGPFQVVESIRPGTYNFKLDTGRLLWSGPLTEKDLIWVYAFPSKDLALAADTGEAESLWTQELRLLEDLVIIRVFPGIESGRIEIHIRRPNTRQRA